MFTSCRPLFTSFFIGCLRTNVTIIYGIHKVLKLIIKKWKSSKRGCRHIFRDCYYHYLACLQTGESRWSPVTESVVFPSRIWMEVLRRFPQGALFLRRHFPPDLHWLVSAFRHL
jgi:hypothetical protein